MKTKPKPSYRIRNWSEYDAALKQRGSLTFWIEEEVIEGWINEQKVGDGEHPNTTAMEPLL